MTKEIHLYFDDTGSRGVDRVPSELRGDGMDCFGLGGILLNEEDVEPLIRSYLSFRKTWKIDYPLHSHEIRGGRGNFGWLKRPENALEFLSALEDMLLQLPILGIAAIIHRPGYAELCRSTDNHHASQMSRLALSFLIDRAAKYARSQNRKLRVFFEQSGPREDDEVVLFAKSLKSSGMPLDPQNPAQSNSLTAADFRDIVRGEPRRKTKATPMLQIADLVLYPMAKGGYDPTYRPYQKLISNRKLIDAVIPFDLRSAQGIKYCFFPPR